MSISKLDFNLYKPFIAVYQSKNIARAADVLLHTPSAVGQRIKELERQLGVKLFIPHARGVQPTKEADELYLLVIDAISKLETAEKAIKDFNTETSCVMRIGSSSSIASVQIKDFISDFVTRYPNVKLDIHYQMREELASMLVNHQLDVIIHRIPFPRTPHGNNLTVDELCDHPRTFFASRAFMTKHNIGSTVTREQFEKLPVILAKKTREDISLLLSVISPKQITEVLRGGCELIYSMVKNGVGIGYTNPNLVTPTDDVELITISDVQLPKHKLGIIYNKGETSKAVQTFVKEIKEFYVN
jgi:DNA-binding transcriptional LysR family regulator